MCIDFRLILSVHISMASNRSSASSENHPPVSLDLHNVIAAVPLNSMPPSSPPRANVSPIPPVTQPTMVFLPIHSSEEDLVRVLAATTGGDAVTGSAALGKVGNPIGNIDISESQDSYMFRVSLPGVERDETFTWFIEPNGELSLKGLTTTGQKNVFRNGMEFEMLTQNLSPPGELFVSFQLPGPIDPLDVKVSFGNDGIFEGLVKKRQP